MKLHFWYKRTNFTQKVSAVQAFNFFFPPPESNYFELVLSLQQCNAPRRPCPAPCLQQHLVPNLPSAAPQDGRCDSGDVLGAGSQSDQKMKTATVTQNTSSTMAITWSKIVGFYFFFKPKIKTFSLKKNNSAHASQLHCCSISSSLSMTSSSFFSFPFHFLLFTIYTVNISWLPYFPLSAKILGCS